MVFNISFSCNSRLRLLSAFILNLVQIFFLLVIIYSTEIASLVRYFTNIVEYVNVILLFFLILFHFIFFLIWLCILWLWAVFFIFVFDICIELIIDIFMEALRILTVTCKFLLKCQADKVLTLRAVAKACTLNLGFELYSVTTVYFTSVKATRSYAILTLLEITYRVHFQQFQNLQKVQS